MHINIFNLIKQLEYSDDLIKIIEVTKAEELGVHIALSLLMEYNLDNTVLYCQGGEKSFTLPLDHEYRDVYVMSGNVSNAILELRQDLDDLRKAHGRLRFIFCLSFDRDLNYMQQLIDTVKGTGIPLIIILDCKLAGIYKLIKTHNQLMSIRKEIHRRNIIEEITYLEEGESPSTYKSMSEVE